MSRLPGPATTGLTYATGTHVNPARAILCSTSNLLTYYCCNWWTLCFERHGHCSRNLNSNGRNSEKSHVFLTLLDRKFQQPSLVNFELLHLITVPGPLVP
jgi:hypothetical protein